MQDASNIVKRIVDGLAEPPRRIAVIGRAGAGKTTVALALGDVLRLPVVHLDRFAWTAGWVPAAPATFDAAHAAAIEGDAWVLDGGYLSRSGWPDRLARADVVVLVEAPLAVCLWRIVRRGLRGRARPAAGRGATRGDGGSRRPDLPPGCEEEINLAFLYWTLTWGRRTRGPLEPLRSGEPGLPPLVRVRR